MREEREPMMVTQRPKYPAAKGKGAKARRMLCALALSVLCAAAAFLAGCAGDGSSSDGEGANGGQGDALTVAWTSNQGDYSLDPAYNYMGWQGSYLGIYEQLFRIDGEFRAEPLLAESAETPDGGLTWHIHIKDGVTFQNGKALDAAAVQASLQRAIDASPRCASSLNVASMSAEGNTLTVVLNSANPSFTDELCEPVTSIIDVESGAPDGEPVGTGPFAIKSVDANGNVDLAAYEGYWQGSPSVKNVRALYLTDDTSKVSALLSGEVQALMNIGDDQLAQFEGDPDYTLHQTNQARAHMIYFNFDSPLMQDEAVRKAISLSFDRQTIADSIYHGAADPAPGVFPEESGYAEGVQQAGYDLDAAREALAEAGWVDTDGNGILDKDGQELSLTMVTYQANAALPQLCEATSSTLDELGIRVTIEVAEQIADRMGRGNWDMGTMAYSTLPTGNPCTYLAAVMGSNGTANYGHYDNARIDELLGELQASGDDEERRSIVTEIQNEALGDYAYVYVVHVLVNDVTAQNVHGLEMQGQYDWLNWQMTVGD